MSLNRYAKARDANEPDIVDALSDIPGCKVERLDWPCDLVVGYRAHNIFLEVKIPGKRYTRKDKAHSEERQKEWRVHWPGQIQVVTSVDEAIHCVLNCYK